MNLSLKCRNIYFHNLWILDSANQANHFPKLCYIWSVDWKLNPLLDSNLLVREEYTILIFRNFVKFTQTWNRLSELDGKNKHFCFFNRKAGNFNSKYRTLPITIDFFRIFFFYYEQEFIILLYIFTFLSDVRWCTQLVNHYQQIDEKQFSQIFRLTLLILYVKLLWWSENNF